MTDMANSISTTSSTSHTMTAFPTPSSKAAANSETIPVGPTSALAGLLESISPATRSAYIAPPASLSRTSQAALKETLDRYAGVLADEQGQRLAEQRRKRKRGDGKYNAEEEVLRIRKIHVEGFEVGQVWAQARRVINALRDDVERAVEGIQLGEAVAVAEPEQPQSGMVSEEVESSENEAEAIAEFSKEEDEEELDETFSGEEVPVNGDLSTDSGQDENGAGHERSAGFYVEDPNELNDGFFSIDDFNRQSEFLEQQDAAADPYTGEASDEEEIDWDADPRLVPISEATSKKSPKVGVEQEEDSDYKRDEDIEVTDEEDDDGPTFGDVDINAPEGASDEENYEGMEDEMDADGDNTNDITYADFFQPPQRKATRGDRQTDFLARQARKAKDAPLENESKAMELAMADVRRDLFEDESEQEDSEDALPEVDPADPRARRSAHERRQAKVAEEIRKLEAASIAKREWTLSGEARAADRPLNSLLEEDLDFERTGKPVPVITAEVSEDIETLIKRRILAMQFDEVIRRRPDALSAGRTRRGAFELDDSKPQQSLAEIYEEEYNQSNDPDTYVSKTDEKLQKEEQEIEVLWKDLSAKLDGLSNWHYKPKPPAPSLNVVGDVATISMEDAQPTTASGMNGVSSMLAPQEIYRAGKDKADIEQGEVVPKTAAPIAKVEMTREQKLRRRRRDKERIRKSGGLQNGQKPEGRKRKEEREVFGDLKKGGVRVIGKKGEIRDAVGNKVQAAKPLKGAGGFKL